MKRDVSDFLKQEGYDQKAIDAFLQQHRDKPRVWRLFEKFALQVAKLGRRYGAKAIMERIRWEEEIENGGEFKVGNSYTALYARVFAWKYPQHADIFEFRTVKGLAGGYERTGKDEGYHVFDHPDDLQLSLT